jgi:fermentation-respiration switch protein FrsA (DUF1100 family)
MRRQALGTALDAGVATSLKFGGCMPHRPTRRSLLWQSAGIAAVVCAAITAAVGEARRPAAADDLAIVAGDLASFAAEGVLISQQIALDRLPHRYAVQELYAIAGKVDDVREALAEHGTRPEHTETWRREDHAARLIQARLEELAAADGARDAVHIGRQLDAAAAEMLALQRTLIR